MFVKKWIITEQLDNINVIADVISSTGTGICWCPVSENDFNNEANLYFFQTLAADIKIVIGFHDFSNISETVFFNSNIIRFFFQVSYFKKENNPCIFLFNSNQENYSEDFLQKLNAVSLEQGFRGLSIFKYKNYININRDIFFSEPGVINPEGYSVFLKKWIDKIIEKKQAREAFIFIPVNTLLIIEKIMNSLENEENNLVKSEIYQLADLLMQSNFDNSSNKMLLQEIKEDSSNKTRYLETQKKNFLEILHWYHNEYEVLPLWYKRFGHIIKVIMGKRSFRSLFSDNVKKYKD